MTVHDEVKDQETHLRINLWLRVEVSQVVQRPFCVGKTEIVVQLIIIVFADR